MGRCRRPCFHGDAAVDPVEDRAMAHQPTWLPDHVRLDENSIPFNGHRRMGYRGRKLTAEERTYDIDQVCKGVQDRRGHPGDGDGRRGRRRWPSVVCAKERGEYTGSSGTSCTSISSVMAVKPKLQAAQRTQTRPLERCHGGSRVEGGRLWPRCVHLVAQESLKLCLPKAV
jgi:hypothetical protein